MDKESSQRQRVLEAVRKALEEAHGGGLRFSELVDYIKNKYPDINKNTICGSLYYLREKIKSGEVNDIENPDRGVYRLVRTNLAQQPFTEDKSKIREDDLYQPFADYLMDELEECTNAVALGGKVFEDKWGTPDVIGIYKFPDYELVKLPVPEVVSAEIKKDPAKLVEAFGQACAYKLFSHKVYLVIPENSEDIGRVESLCLKFGIGLILFNIKDNQPQFQIRTRALKSEPDYFYLNNYLNKLKQKAPDSFKKLLG